MSLPDRFQQAEKGFSLRGSLQLSIYRTGGGHISAEAIRQLFDEQPDALLVGADPDADELGFVAADPNTPDAYAFSTDDNGLGGDVRFGTALDRLGIDTSEFDETQYVPLREDDGVVVADVSELTTGDSGGGETDGQSDGTSSDGEESLEAVCKKCGESHDDGPCWDDVDDESLVNTLDIDDLAGAFADGDRPVAAKLREVLDIAIADDPIQTTCGDLGDAIGEDGRKVVHDLKSLDEYAVERTDYSDDNGASIWRIERLSDPVEEFDEAVDERTGGSDFPALDPDDTDLSESTIADCADSVNSIQALADLLDEPVGRVRAYVHDSDQIDLPDKPPRPGVDR